MFLAHLTAIQRGQEQAQLQTVGVGGQLHWGRQVDGGRPATLRGGGAWGAHQLWLLQLVPSVNRAGNPAPVTGVHLQ